MIKLGPTERYMGKAIKEFGYEHYIGEIGKRGAKRTVCTDLIGNELKEINNVVRPKLENLKANFGVI